MNVRYLHYKVRELNNANISIQQELNQMMMDIESNKRRINQLENNKQQYNVNTNQIEQRLKQNSNELMKKTFNKINSGLDNKISSIVESELQEKLNEFEQVSRTASDVTETNMVALNMIGENMSLNDILYKILINLLTLMAQKGIISKNEANKIATKRDFFNIWQHQPILKE